MFEHVGWRNYRTFLRAVSDRLVRDGLFLLHTIGTPVTARAATPGSGGSTSSRTITSLGRADRGGSEGLFQVEDWHNFGADYDRP
jgi:cyclopropane-fatty-acyl-phospholipid synthase